MTRMEEGCLADSGAVELTLSANVNVRELLPPPPSDLNLLRASVHTQLDDTAVFGILLVT